MTAPDGNSSSKLSPVELSIVLPCYLEGESLPTLLPEIKAAAQALTPFYEVLIVDTQTNMDNTAEVCLANGVRHVNRSGGNTFGDAVRTGIAEARGTYMLCMDADGSHRPVYFASMWAERERSDITIGSRYVPGGDTDNPRLLIWMSYVVNFTFRVAFSIPAKDVTNSFRLYRRSILTSMKLESDNFDILEEILIRAIVRKPPARVSEVPVHFAQRMAGVSKRNLIEFAFGYLKTLQRMQRFTRSAKKEIVTQ